MKKIAMMASIAVLVLGTTSCVKQKETQTTFRTNEALEAVNVKVQTVQTRDVDQIQEFTATVEADVVNNIAPQAPVRIRRINVEVGNRVVKGQTLVVLDDNSLAQAKIQLDNAELEFNRYDELYKVGGISKSAWDAQKARVDQQRRAYENLAENARLVSPINGVVTARNYDKGDMYSMAQPIFVVEQIQPVKMLVNVSESLFTQVSEGMEFDITVDAYPGEIFKGKVNLLYPTVNAATHTFPVEVICENKDQRLRPGMFARVTANFGTNHHIVIPDNAVVKQQGSGEYFVYVLQSDNTVKYTLVELGKRLGNRYEIISGINEGDRIVTEGQIRLKDGVNVTVK